MDCRDVVRHAAGGCQRALIMSAPSLSPVIDRWHQRLRDLGAEWEYQGGEFCALYSVVEKVSDYYFNSDVVSSNEPVLEALCREVYVPEIHRRKLSVDWVVSFLPYGAPFARTLARVLNVESAVIESRGDPVLPDGLSAHSRVLVVSDDIFTGGSIARVVDAALARQATVEPVLFAFGNFSGASHLGGREIVSVINREVRLSTLSESPLVGRGVRPLRARTHWDQFVRDGARLG
jgi:orotate phosphoribosyltransferase